MKKHRYYCTMCKGTNVLQDAWVSLNTEETSVFDTFFCEDCDGECSVDSEEIEEKITDKHELQTNPDIARYAMLIQNLETRKLIDLPPDKIDTLCWAVLCSFVRGEWFRTHWYKCASDPDVQKWVFAVGNKDILTALRAEIEKAL